MSDLRAFNSFNLSLTLISSGGFLPVNNLDTIINTKFSIIYQTLMLYPSCIIVTLLPFVPFNTGFVSYKFVNASIKLASS